VKHARSTEIALLTERRFSAPQAPEGDWYLANILHDDRLLSDAFRAHGFQAVRVEWSDPTIDWSRFRAAVFRTTWDYFKRFEEFTSWLDRVESQTTLCNAPSTIRWNMDKHYLADLERQGVAVVPSRFLEQSNTISIAALLGESGWSQAIVKPCVAGGAFHTYRVDRENVAEIDSIVGSLLQERSMLFQPFMEEIVRTGEDTLMVLDGRYTHAVRKMAKAGDFRVGFATAPAIQPGCADARPRGASTNVDSSPPVRRVNPRLILPTTSSRWAKPTITHKRPCSQGKNAALASPP
jgi:hypothetical protein